MQLFCPLLTPIAYSLLFFWVGGLGGVMTEVCFAQVTKDVSPQGQECLTTVEEVCNKSNKGGV